MHSVLTELFLEAGDISVVDAPADTCVGVKCVARLEHTASHGRNKKLQQFSVALQPRSSSKVHFQNSHPLFKQ